MLLAHDFPTCTGFGNIKSNKQSCRDGAASSDPAANKPSKQSISDPVARASFDICKPCACWEIRR